MKRIMHIAQAAGGVERYLFTLLSKLNKDKYENILVLSPTYDLKKFEPFSEYIECVEMYREINLLNELEAVSHIRKLIMKYRPDIVYMHSSKAGVIGRLANIGIKNVSIYNAHGWAFNMKCNGLKRGLYACIEKQLSPLCTGIIAISDYERESALKRHVCKYDKISVIYNGIDLEEHKRCSNSVNRDTLKIPTDAYVVGTVGRLDKQKAPDVFVKAASKIIREIPNAFFVMVGSGNEQQYIEDMLQKMGLTEKFVITGWVENPLEYIRIFDSAMLLSRWEGFGLVLPEYMLEGKPIVATRADAIPNIIMDGKNGILVDVDDYNAAAEAVIRIYQDTSLATSLCQNGFSCVYERLNAERMVKETEMMFETLLMKYQDNINYE